jgi:hypothetical protein
MWQYHLGQPLDWLAVIVASAIFHRGTLAGRMQGGADIATSHRRRAAHPATSMCWRSQRYSVYGST